MFITIIYRIYVQYIFKLIVHIMSWLSEKKMRKRLCVSLLLGCMSYHKQKQIRSSLLTAFVKFEAIQGKNSNACVTLVLISLVQLLALKTKNALFWS